MVEKICNYILSQMRKSMPEMDDEKAEVIQYGLQLIVGEIPKLFLLVVVSFLLGIGWYTIFAYIALLPYRTASGGFHLKTHIGCILGTVIFYYGNVFLSKILELGAIEKYGLILFSLIFGIIMITLYAPADTENVPIISKKERKHKKILSYITLAITLIVATIVQNQVISNILIIGTIAQTITITRLAYTLTKNKYGYENYNQELETAN